jgi:intracellular septation protein
MMSAQMTLPSNVWKYLNLCWAGFFIAVGCLNVYVMFNYNTNDWVTFKTFVVPALMAVFIVLQMFFIYKYIPDSES